MTSIARKNLLEDIPRFLVAQAGIMFAVSLVTIQTGLLSGFTRSTVLLIEGSDADLWVASDKMVHFDFTEPILYDLADKAEDVEGVARAEALMLGGARWRPPEAESSPLKLIGFDPRGTLFTPGTVISGNLKALEEPYAVMVDRSRLPSLQTAGIGDRAQVDSLPATIVALTEGSQSIVASTFVFASLETTNTYTQAGFSSRLNCRVNTEGDFDCTTIYERSETEDSEIPPTQPLSQTDPITYVLIGAGPGVDLDALKQRLDRALPGTKTYTKEEMSRLTRYYWQVRTGLGFVLGLGAVVGVVVGTIVVAQILYSSVSDRIKEFGTLKAMGASDGVLYGIIVEQALWMAILGYIPGMLLCLGLRIWVANKGIILLITPISAAGVLGITIAMCVGSAFFAIQKVTRIDPAMVFKA